MIDTERGFDLDAYMGRIGFAMRPTATMEFLGRLILHHTQAIPFENIDPFLHRPVSLDLDALQAKLIHGGRGGYCFEQNFLLAHALVAVGFEVTGLAARVMWNRPETDMTPRGHMLLQVLVEGRSVICDVGFGVMTLTGPLELTPHKEQSTPHEIYRLMPSGHDYRLEARLNGAWKPLYRFGMEEQFRCDYEVTNYYLSTRPESHFRRTLMVAGPAEQRRYSLSNTRLTARGLDGSAEVRELESPDEIIEVLRSTFRIAVLEPGAIRDALSRENVFQPLDQGTKSA